jgi:hypothetical protein
MLLNRCVLIFAGMSPNASSSIPSNPVLSQKNWLLNLSERSDDPVSFDDVHILHLGHVEQPYRYSGPAIQEVF